MTASRAAPRGDGAARFVLLASAAFATSPPLARWARPADPIVVAFGRVALAGALLLLADPRGALASVRALSARRRLLTGAAGALLAAHFSLFLWGLDETSLPAAAALVALEPLSVVACAWAIFGLRPTPREALGVVIATAGAVFIARSAGAGEHTLFGDLLVLGAVALYGFYVSLARGLGDALPPVHYAGLVYTAAAVSLAAWLVASGGFVSGLAALEPRSMLAITALAVVPTVLGHTLVQTAARSLSPSIIALASPGETLGSIALGAALLGAIPTASEAAGALVILCGAVLAITGRARKPGLSA